MLTADESVEDTAPRPLRSDAVRNAERISIVAMEAFAERGLEVSMADVAHRAGVGVATVYRRFGDKDGLITALFESKVGQVVAMAERADNDDDPVHALLHLLLTCSEMLSANKGLRQLILNGSFPPGDTSPPALDRLYPIAERLVARAKAAGWLRDSFAATDVPVLLVTVQAVRDLGGSVQPDLWKRTLITLIDGIRTDSRTPVDLDAPAALTEPETRTMMRNAGV